MHPHLQRSRAYRASQALQAPVFDPGHTGLELGQDFDSGCDTPEDYPNPSVAQ